MNVYDIVTEKVLEQLEKGNIPWRKPWGKAGKPKNYVSDKDYRGINILLLSWAGHASPFWLTMKQANELGGKIKKGAKSQPVVFFHWKETENEEKELNAYPILRYYRVFNAEHIEGIDFPEPSTREVLPLEECEHIIEQMPKRPEIHYGGDRACYSPAEDIIWIPAKHQFISSEEHYGTVFHEIAHCTGHASRLGRHKEDGADCRFGSAPYAREELVAEMSAAFLCATAGIEAPIIENTTAYLQSWIKVLKGDKRLLLVAAAQAQKAADFVLGLESETAKIQTNELARQL